MQKSLVKDLTDHLVESKVCPAVLTACKHNRLTLNKRYLKYSGNFDFRTDLKINLFIYYISLNNVKMPNTEINRRNRININDYEEKRMQ